MKDRVSRAGQKLADAAEAFRFDFRGKTVLDIGSSTGGFTEYALTRGATRVVAVEKGTNQMASPLRFDPRVELHEKTDIFDVTLNDIDVALADVSFISLKPVLKHVKGWAKEYLVMLKPQFEAREDQLVGGVVKNERMRREICKDFEFWLKKNGFAVVGKRDNLVAGKRGGNVERFYYLKSC